MRHDDTHPVRLDAHRKDDRPIDHRTIAVARRMIRDLTGVDFSLDTPTAALDLVQALAQALEANHLRLAHPSDDE